MKNLIAYPIAEGAKIRQAALESGLTVNRAERELEELREELAGRCSCPAKSG
jgi:hypothetical protein